MIGHKDFSQPPDTIRYLGVLNKCTFDSLPKYFGVLTFEEQKKFLRSIFRAENGILDDSLSTDKKQVEEAQEILSDTTEKLFDHLFSADEVEEKYRSVYRTIFTTLMESLDPERRVQLVFSIMKNFQEGEKPTADDIMASILNIGVAFKKAAQILSERNDLLPESLCSSLGEIKDNATPISKSTIFEIFRREGMMGEITKIKGLLGAASVGQVHMLETTDGKQSVGKVRSPIVDKYRMDDVKIIEKIIEQIKVKHGANVPNFAEEISRLLEEESNFNNEETNLNLLLPVFDFVSKQEQEADEEHPQFYSKIELGLPRITRCEESALIEELAPGISLNDLYYLSVFEKNQKGIGFQQVSEKVLSRAKVLFDKLKKQKKLQKYLEALDHIDEVYLKLVDLVVAEIFEHGVFHADKHRGNLMLDISEEDNSALITAIDFGNVIQISKENQSALKDLLGGLAFGDSGSVLKGVKDFVGRNLSPQVQAEIEQVAEQEAELKTKMEKISLVIRDNFEFEERKDFVNILKGLVSSFYIFDEISEERRAEALMKVAAYFIG